MKFAFSDNTFICFYLHAPHYKMPKHSRVTESGTTELPFFTVEATDAPQVH